MQPYQQASDMMREKNEQPARLLKKGGSLALTAASLYGGGSMISRAMPFLNQYIPADLAIKGLSKINPKFGQFIEKSLKNGHSFDQIKEFILEKLETAEESRPKEKQPDQKNIIQKYSPELFNFMKDLIGKGKSPLEAGALATIGLGGKNYSKEIKKMESDNKADWSSIIESVFGTAQQPQGNQQMSQMTQEPPQQQQQQQSGYNADQALMQMMNKFSQSLR